MRKTVLHKLLLVASIFILHGCQSAPGPAPLLSGSSVSLVDMHLDEDVSCGSFGGLEAACPAADLFQEYGDLLYMQAQQAADLRSELAQALIPDACSDTRIKLAMLHTHPGLKAPAEADITTLLAPCLNGSLVGDAPELRYLARVLLVQLNDKALQVKRLRAMRRQVQAMERQLEALKAIERNIHERDRSQNGTAGE